MTTDSSSFNLFVRMSENTSLALGSVSTLQSLLRNSRIECMAKKVGETIYDVEIHFGDSCRRVLLDFSSEFVRRFVSDACSKYWGASPSTIYSSMWSPDLDGSGSLQTLSIRTPRIVELTPEDGELIEEDEPAAQKEPVVEFPRTTRRVIALPYTSSAVNRGPQKKRQRRTIAALLNEKEEFTCRHCFKHFDRKYNLTRHENAVHSEKVVFRCPVCSTVYRHAFHFADHMRSHDNHHYLCDDCHQSLPSRNALKAHRIRNCGENKKESDSSMFRRDGKRKSCAYTPDAATTSKETARGSTGKLRIPIDFKSGTPATTSYAHLLSTTAGVQSLAAAYGIQVATAYQLTATTVAGPTDECSADCLTTLTPMFLENKTINMVSMSMARPEDQATYEGFKFMTIPFPAVYCVKNSGDCGATTPLHLYYDAVAQDFYVSTDAAGPSEGAAPYPYATERLAMAASPLCYVWLNTTLTTTTTTTTTTPAVPTTTGTGPTTTTAYSTLAATTYTGPSTTGNPYWTTAYPIYADSASNETTTTGGSTTTVAGGSTTTTVAGANTTTVAGGSTTTVAGDNTTTVAGDNTTTVAGSNTTVAGSNTTAVAGSNTTVAGDNTTTVAGASTTTVAGGSTTTVITTTDQFGNGETTSAGTSGNGTTTESSITSRASWKWGLVILGSLLAVGSIIGAVAAATVKFIGASGKSSPVMTYQDRAQVMPPQPMQSAPSPQPFTVGGPAAPPGVPSGIYYS